MYRHLKRWNFICSCKGITIVGAVIFAAGDRDDRVPVDIVDVEERSDRILCVTVLGPLC